MQNNYFLKLIDTNEPSNIQFDENLSALNFSNNLPSYVENNWNKRKNKLLVLCSDGEINERSLVYCKTNDSFNWVWYCGEYCTKANNFLVSYNNTHTRLDRKDLIQIIATNSPTLTPN